MVPKAILELAETTVRSLKRKGVDTADLRWERRRQEELVVRNRKVHHISRSATEGISLRVITGGAWGYAASCRLDRAGFRETAAKALEMARAIRPARAGRIRLDPVEPVRAHYRTPIERDPFTVPLPEKLDHMLEVNEQLGGDPRIQTALSSLLFIKTHKLFLSTEGSRIEQEVVESGGALEATAAADGQVQRRSYPAGNGVDLAQAGYEQIARLDFLKEAPRVRREAVALLSAKECPAGTMPVILMPDQLILQIHESCGHPVELDRALGMELSFAGGSFLTPDRLGRFRYGSDPINITADATLPGGCGTFGYDDEGVPAQRVPIIREGIFVGYLSSRETAPRVGLHSSGAMRADGWNAVPIIRMTNVSLEPGEGTLEELIGETRRGVLLATNKSWSIDDLRLNFQFGTEIGWEIRDGRIGGMLKNPVYTGITPEFWGSCSAVAGAGDWRLHGIPNCGKGEPMQTMHVGHGASPARFERVQVGRKK